MSSDNQRQDGVHLGQAQVDDAPRLSALAIQVFLDTYARQGIDTDIANEVLTNYTTEKFREWISSPTQQVIALFRDEYMLGFAHTDAQAEAPCDALMGGLEIVRLYVQPGSQGQGQGAALLDQCERYAGANAIPSVWLTVWHGNLRAIAFYSDHGYRDFGEMNYVIADRRYENRIYAKLLA